MLDFKSVITRYRSFAVVAGALLAFSPLANAAAGWTSYGEVQELTPTIHQRFLLKLPVTKNPSGCDEPALFYQDYDAPGAELMFRTLLEAVSAGKRVKVRVTGRCALHGYSEISAVTIVP